MKWDGTDPSRTTLPETWLFPHYFDALNVLFRIENALRLLVFIVLKSEKQGEWTQTSVNVDGKAVGTIESIARRREAQCASFGYLGHAVGCPLLHLTSGELIDIIFSEGNWKAFAPFFPAKRDMVRAKLDEITTVRNALAHFRPIKTTDVESVKANADHVLSRGEEAVQALLFQWERMASNTEASWFRKLGSLDRKGFHLRACESVCRRWVQISMFVELRLIRADGVWPACHGLTVATLSVPSMLRRHNLITASSIFVTEHVGQKKASENLPPVIYKEVCLHFSRALMESQGDAIVAELQQLCSAIDGEMSMVIEDQEARGDMVMAKSVGVLPLADAGRRDAPVVRSGRLEGEASQGDPPEYWGSYYGTSCHFVSSVATYPWMPTKVCAAEDIPF